MPISIEWSNCPSCGSHVAGKFCAECGAALTLTCSACNAPLEHGSRFCHDCGALVRAGGRAAHEKPIAPARHRSRLIATIVAIPLAAAIVIIATRIGLRPAPVEAGLAPVMQQGVVSAPDISSMSPRERASRLYGRVMRLHEERKTDSIAFFAPMALAAYMAITDIDDDGRYDMARVAMIAGALPIARAQADTILRRNETHLLGLLLATDLARASSDEPRARSIERTLVAAAKRERARALPEYKAHETEITTALKRIRTSANQ